MAGSRLHEESPSVAKASPAGPVARPSYTWPSFTWHGLHTWALVMAATAAAKILLPSPAEEMGVNWRVWEDASWDLGLPYLLSFAHLTASLVLAHRVEALLYGGAVMRRHGLRVHLANLAVLLALPLLLLQPQCSHLGIVLNFLICFNHIVLFMKLVSFIHVNQSQQLSEEAEDRGDGENEKKALKAPRLGHLLRFWLMPSLSYSALAGPSATAPLPSLLLRLLELVVGVASAWGGGFHLLAGVAGQVVAAMDQGLPLAALERFLTLTLVSGVVWMVSFYIIFYSFFHLLAGLTGAPDSRFFMAWWNSSDMEQFWRAWNLPVHRWFASHLYRPLVAAGWSRVSCSLLVFLASAALHEFLFSAPLRLVGHAAFLGMLFQPGLVLATRWLARVAGPRVGNMAIWVVLVFGNSAGVVAYRRQWAARAYCA